MLSVLKIIVPTEFASVVGRVSTKLDSVTGTPEANTLVSKTMSVPDVPTLPRKISDVAEVVNLNNVTVPEEPALAEASAFIVMVVPEAAANAAEAGNVKVAIGVAKVVSPAVVN